MHLLCSADMCDRECSLFSGGLFMWECVDVFGACICICVRHMCKYTWTVDTDMPESVCACNLHTIDPMLFIMLHYYLMREHSECGIFEWNERYWATFYSTYIHYTICSGIACTLYTYIQINSHSSAVQLFCTLIGTKITNCIRILMAKNRNCGIYTKQKCS